MKQIVELCKCCLCACKKLKIKHLSACIKCDIIIIWTPHTATAIKGKVQLLNSSHLIRVQCLLHFFPRIALMCHFIMAIDSKTNKKIIISTSLEQGHNQ